MLLWLPFGVAAFGELGRRATVSPNAHRFPPDSFLVPVVELLINVALTVSQDFPFRVIGRGIARIHGGVGVRIGFADVAGFFQPVSLIFQWSTPRVLMIARWKWHIRFRRVATLF